MIRRARHVVVVADSSKLDRAAFAQICPLAEIDELITDVGATPDVIRGISDEGVAVAVA